MATDAPSVVEQKVEQMAREWTDERAGLIAVLQQVQDEFNYLPPEALPIVAEKLAFPLSQVYSVATFYSSFSLEPRGRHIVTCCSGTACHVRGGERVVREVGKQLGIAPGQTTPDQEFTLETVNCLGACALGPVVVMDGKYNGKMTPTKVRQILHPHKSNG